MLKFNPIEKEASNELWYMFPTIHMLYVVNT